MGTTPSLFPSLLRTVVPVVVGAVITWLASIGVNFSSEAVTIVVTALISGGYYTVFRVIERAAPTGGVAEKVAGFLLGFVRPPVYPPSTATAAAQRVESVTPSRGPDRPA
jgi:hypothetical protein